MATPASEEIYFPSLEKIGENPLLFFIINFQYTKCFKWIISSSFLVIYLLGFGYLFTYLLQRQHLFTGTK